MKKFLSLLITIILFSFQSQIMAQLGWSTLNTTYTGNFKDVHFVSSTTGFAVGGNNINGTIYKTTNGGASWTSTAITGASFESVWFDGSNNGWAAGLDGKIYKTSNGGGLWTLQTTGSTADLNCIIFPASQSLIGYAAGGANFLKTSNGGTVWNDTTISFPGITSIDFQSVAATSTTHGIVCGGYNFFNGFIIMTTNGGISWSPFPFTTSAKLNDLSFPTSTIGYAVGNAGGIFKTTNGGTSWLAQTSGIIGDLNGVYFVNANIGYAVGDSGIVLKTIDGGSSWNRQSTNILNTLQNIHAPSSTLAFIAADNNKILKTISGGNSLLINAPDETTYCNGFANLHVHTTYTGQGTLTYTWTPSPYISSSNDSLATVGPLTQDESFIITVSDGTLTQIDTIHVSVLPLPTDSICIVAVDSLTNHPVVVFEKHISGPIDYYKIYRESNVAGIFDSIGFIPADSAGVFVDVNANVKVRQYSYKISNVDSCGNESIQSLPHKTMNLQVNAGAGTSWNLLWTPYEGIFVQSYEIWRGTDTINMSLIGTVPGSNVSYSDLTPPSGGLYYFVRIVSAYVCQPYNFKANTNYHTSRSNHANNGIFNPALQADFNATPLSGNSPLNVQFTDVSSGIPTTWKWYFGDGNTSTSQSPNHTYSADGKYTVKLLVTNNTSQDSIEKVDYITVGPVGMEEVDPNQHIKIYPNPLPQSQALFIEYDQFQIEQLHLLNIVGKEVFVNTERTTGLIKLETSSLSSGVYMLKLITTSGKIITQKIIVK